jgi:cytochrome c oxidase subunit II
VQPALDPSIQSALHPASPASREIAGLWWFIFTTTAMVFVIVMGLLLVAIFRRAPGELRPSSPRSTRFVVIGGALIPAGILLSFLVASLKTTLELKLPARALTVQVIGHQWWWEIYYPQQKIATANEIEIPVGQPVRLELKSADVIHSFWVPSLNGKIDLIPGHPNVFWIAADRRGTYRGQCAEYCGLQHAHMAFFVVALPPDAFRAWAAARQKPHREPSAPRLVRGRQMILLAGCKDCHTIAGTGARGKLGPDLTHVASRLTLGAGTLPNTAGTLEGWIADSQAMKPGNKMPRMYLAPEDLHALREYLESLD